MALDIKLDDARDLVIIEGVVYNQAYFRMLSEPKPGMLYKISKKKTPLGDVINIDEFIDPRSKKYLSAASVADKKEIGDGSLPRKQR